MSQFTVIYDANVLYPLYLRDLLMRLALTGLYRARWTGKILDEWSSNLLEVRPELADKISRTIGKMNSHAHDCLIEGHDRLIPCIEGLPDPNDRHVVAAAMHAGAELIVTCNLKDFPVEVLAQYGIEAIHPDDFIVDLLDLNLAKCLAALQKMRASYSGPKMNQDEFLAVLMKQQLPQTVCLLEQYKIAF